MPAVYRHATVTRQTVCCDHSHEDDCGEWIGAVDKITGVVQLARNAVFAEEQGNRVLGSAWSALDMALEALQVLREDLEGLTPEQRAASKALELQS